MYTTEIYKTQDLRFCWRLASTACWDL